MNSTSASRTAYPRVRPAASVLAAVAVLLASSIAGCAPEPADRGVPTTAEQEPGSPSGTAAPTEAGGDEQAEGGGTASGEPDAGIVPDDADPRDEDGDADADEGDVNGAGTEVNDTDDWREPEDPTAEGPTAAPALPEVDGRIGDGIKLPTEVVVSLASISTATLTAETPGEQSGPAVVVEVQVTNESDVPQSVGSATVSLSTDGGEIGVPTWASPNAPLQGEIAAGATAVGTYVFMLDPADERSVTVRVNYSAGEPVATFTGTTP